MPKDMKKKYSQNSKIVYSLQPWESDILNKKIIKINKFFIATEEKEDRYNSALRLLKRFIPLAKKRNFHAAYIRVNEIDIPVIHALETSGFLTIESLLTFYCPKEIKVKALSGCDIVDYQDKYLTSLRDIASRNFKYSRFHADPRVSKERADLSRAEWVTNACNGRAEKVFVAKKRGKAVGFVACRSELNPKGGRTGIIDLIAVDSNFQRQGIASDLMKAASKYYHRKNLGLTVGTQAKNIPSVNLYTRLGFQLTRSELTLVRYFRK